MIKQLILSFLIITGVAGSVFAGTKAILSPEVRLTSNSFSTGTVGLQISKSTSSAPSSFTDASITGFVGKLLPGQAVSQPVWLRNSSTDTDLSIAAQIANVSGEIPPADITVTFTPVANDGTDSGGAPVSATMAGWLTPGSLSSTILHNNGKQRYRMDLELAASSTAAGTINFDFVFTGTQTP
jgi:hypothetical protein